jgi:1,2-dihydroxy-3-keto-5-methylthiopentene dioxygenase
MTLLVLHHDQAAAEPLLRSHDPERIRTELDQRGIRYERWAAPSSLPAGADDEEILRLYTTEITRVQAGGRYRTVDAIRMTPDHPEREALRRKFLAEHTHDADEVRFFVEGSGLFCLHLGEEILQVLCERGDWIAVPAGTRHWFDMGSRPSFSALRFFDDDRGWVPRFTGDAIAGRYPLLDELRSAMAGSPT